jgi:hypothetical protein
LDPDPKLCGKWDPDPKKIVTDPQHWIHFSTSPVGMPAIFSRSQRHIKLIQDFVSGYRNEDMKQNLMLVARDNRKKLKKTMTKEELKNV